MVKSPRNFALYIEQQIWISFTFHLPVNVFVIFFEIVKPFPSDEYQEQVNVLRDVKHVKHKFLGLNPLKLTEPHDQLLAILNCIDT